MIAPFLLLAAQAAPNAAPAPKQDCVRAVGSTIVICGTPPEQQGQPQQAPQQVTYRVPRLPRGTAGPVVPGASANLGKGVRATLRGQASNSGRARRNKPVATLSVPF